MTVRVRLFAAAAEAAGSEETAVAAAPLGSILTALDTMFGPGFARIRSQCAVLVDGVRHDPGEMIPSGATVDILPPFAGG